MSGYAHQWAKRQTVGDSSAKSLLKTYAHWAGEDYVTWVTNEEIELDTELNIQTIRRARAKLIELGYLVETDRRIGRTQSIIVYQMLAPAGSTIVQSVDQRTGETISLSPPTVEEYSLKRGGKSTPSKSRRTKGDEKPSPLKSKAPLNLPGSPSKSHVEGGEISLEGGGNLEGNIALEEQEKEVDKQPARRTPRVALHDQILNLNLPSWLTFEVWDSWCEHREAKVKDAPWTMAAARISIRKLDKLRAAGQAPDVTIDEAVLRGWTGLFPVNASSLPAAAAGGAASTVPVDWYMSDEGHKRQGDALAVPPPKDDSPESWLRYKARVVKASGPGVWMERMLAQFAGTESMYEQMFAYFNDVRAEASTA